MGIAYVLWILIPVAWAALPWLPPSAVAGRVVAALQLAVSAAALVTGMPAGNLPWWFLVPGVGSALLRLCWSPAGESSEGREA